MNKFRFLYMTVSTLTLFSCFAEARVCFLGDGIGCEDKFAFAQSDGLDSSAGANNCIKEGYTIKSCDGAFILVGKCPYHPAYYQSCGCPTSYITCTKPEYGVGSVCGGNMYASCRRDDEKACKEENPSYVNVANCSIGWQLKDGAKCSYNASYGICCNKCSGYDEASIPNGYVIDGTACESCWGTRYKIKPNPCSGYSACTEFGPVSGSQTCLSGTTTLYKTCKTCPNLGNLSSCPSNAVCTYEECSGKYYLTGCKINANIKDSENYWCDISILKCYVKVDQKCVTTPDCTDLGYTKTASQCSGKDMLKCPFDTTKVFCKN